MSANAIVRIRSWKSGDAHEDEFYEVTPDILDRAQTLHRAKNDSAACDLIIDAGIRLMPVLQLQRDGF